MTKKNIHFIINPISGTGKQKDILRKIEQIIDEEIYSCQLHFTERKNHATAIAQELSKSSSDIIVAVGGDGTVNEISKALVNTESVMGIIPTGSGNGLARHLKIPRNIKKALKLINDGNMCRIDTCSANDHFFINVSGIGYDGHIAQVFSNSTKRGIKTYVKLIASEWSSYTPKKYRIEVNNKIVFEDKALLVSFANASQYGNNAHISPTSVIDDGKLEICIIKPFRIHEIPRMLISLIRQRLHVNKNVLTIPCTNANIKQENAKAHLDGEPINLNNQIELKIKPRSLKIITGC